MSLVQRVREIAPAFLRASLHQQWPIGVLALVSLAPGVAALVAWLQVAWALRSKALPLEQLSWLLPPALLDLVTPAGVLVGCGLVTLLVGCLGLSNAYLASVERRLGDLGLLLKLGLRRFDLMSLLLLEAVALAALGTGFGIVLGAALTVASWLAARDYFQLSPGFTMYAAPFLIGGAAGMLAAMLFVGITGVATSLRRPPASLSSRPERHWMRDWGQWRLSTLGVIFTGLLTALVGLVALGPLPALALTALALSMAVLLNAGSWLLTRFYWRLPTPTSTPLWALAVQGLARHRRQTTGMTLAMTAGALGVGLAALGSLGRTPKAIFPLWVAAVLLATCASLVMTTAALAALERRQELGLLAALGARPARIRRFILLEYGIVAVGGGALGALLALLAWRLTGAGGSWLVASVIVALEVIAAVVTAWIGAAPVLWLISRQPPGVSLRDRPWLVH